MDTNLQKIIDFAREQGINVIDLQVALVEHGCGTNAYVAIDREQLDVEVFGFVETWWDTEILDSNDEPLPMPVDMHFATRQYFTSVDRESVVYTTAAVLLSAGQPNVDTKSKEVAPKEDDPYEGPDGKLLRDADYYDHN